jgi:hypothetical protein
MPVCNRCGKMGPTADMRRSPKQGAVCKDKPKCKERQNASNKGTEAQDRN